MRKSKIFKANNFKSLLTKELLQILKNATKIIKTLFKIFYNPNLQNMVVEAFNKQIKSSFKISEKNFSDVKDILKIMMKKCFGN